MHKKGAFKIAPFCAYLQAFFCFTIEIIDKEFDIIVGTEPVIIPYISHKVTAGRLNRRIFSGLLHQKPITARQEPIAGKRLFMPSPLKNVQITVRMQKKTGIKIC